MSSNDNKKNGCNGHIDDIEKKNQEKNITVPNVIKYFNTVLHSRDTGCHRTSLININTKKTCHCTILH